MEIEVSVSQNVFIWQEHRASCETYLDSYGTVSEANSYFDNRLNSEAWINAEENYKRQALVMATRAIDRLNFVGEKASSTQDFQFPRGKDTKIPSDIKIAAFEIAIRLLDGVDIDLEIDALAMTSQGVSSLRTTYDRGWMLEHKRAGIPSAIAWDYLKPYLRSPSEIVLSRVN